MILVSFPKNILVLFSHSTLRLRPNSHAERSAEGEESKSRCTGCRTAAHCQGVAQCDSGLQIQYLILETALPHIVFIINVPRLHPRNPPRNVSRVLNVIVAESFHQTRLFKKEKINVIDYKERDEPDKYRNGMKGQSFS